MKILAIGAHPDDIEFGVSGSLFKHKTVDDEIHLVTVTLGEGGGEPAERKVEAKKSASFMDSDSLIFLNFSVGDFNAVRHEYIDSINKIICSLKPDRIYTHTPFDTHQIHTIVSHCSIIAAKNVNEIYLYETPSTTNLFHPNCFIDISNFLDKKIKCIHFHKSQVNKSYFHIPAIIAKARMRYFQANLTPIDGAAAEAFYIEKRVL